MSMVSKLWHKYKHHKALKFVVVGILNTLLGYGVFALLISFGVHYLPAISISTVVGVTNSYVWNKYFTYKKHEKSLAELARFILVYVVLYICNVLLLALLIDNLHVNPFVSQGIVVTLLTGCSYLGHTFWSFK